MSQEKSEKPKGNTVNPLARFQLYRWMITIPYNELVEPNILQLWHELNHYGKEFYFQVEQGKESGYMHYQICVSLKTKEYFAAVKNIFGNNAHIEPAKDWHAAKAYCTKEDTRVLGPYDHKRSPLDIINVLWPWQNELLQELKGKPEKRKIIWYYNPNGNYGKSEFCKFMYVMYKACVLSNARTVDIAYALPENPEIILFDLPRDSQDRFNYSVLEQLKNGLIFSSKYESGTKVFNTPHIVVFSNGMPDEEALTEDRWDIREIHSDTKSVLKCTNAQEKLSRFLA